MSTDVSSICVLRSTGMKDEITCSLKDSLRDLKVAISQSAALGMIPVEHQRIFHLGRELKTLGRSLEALGVGRLQGLNKTVIHVHATPAGSATHLSATATNSVDVPPLPQHRRMTQSARKSLSQPAPRTLSVRNRMPTEAPEVVNLDSDDDDDDVVVVTIDVDSTTNHQSKRRRQI